MVNGQRTITKKTLTFTAETTLLDAIKKAQDTYTEMMEDSENRSILSKDTLKPTMTFKQWYFGDGQEKPTCLWGDFDYPKPKKKPSPKKKNGSGTGSRTPTFRTRI